MRRSEATLTTRATVYRCLPSCSVSFFFFKQKTAYEIMPSLVGSEMCIRDSPIHGMYVHSKKKNETEHEGKHR